MSLEPLVDPRYLAAVIEIAVRVLPHTFREVAAERGDTVGIEIRGASGGQWTLSRDERHWTLHRGHEAPATARVRLSDDTAWRLLFNALPERDAVTAVEVVGRHGPGSRGLSRPIGDCVGAAREPPLRETAARMMRG